MSYILPAWVNRAYNSFIGIWCVLIGQILTSPWLCCIGPTCVHILNHQPCDPHVSTMAVLHVRTSHELLDADSVPGLFLGYCAYGSNYFGLLDIQQIPAFKQFVSYCQCAAGVARSFPNIHLNTTSATSSEFFSMNIKWPFPSIPSFSRRT